MAEFFGVDGPETLYKKLAADYESYVRDSTNGDLAINVFHSADSLLDWVDEKGLRESIPVLRIASHLSNGVKHRKIDRHNAVVDAPWTRYVERGCIEPGCVEERLEIKLTDEVAELMGAKVILAENLIREVMRYWADRFPQEKRPSGLD